MKVTRSIVLYLLFLVCLSVPPVILQYSGHDDLLVPKFWLFFFFLSGLTLLVIGSILFVQHKNQEYYAQAFLAATTVKILALLIFILIFSAKNNVDKHIFIADFMYTYFFNMGFEVYILLRNLRHKNLR
jgi:hypothetical protein